MCMCARAAILTLITLLLCGLYTTPTAAQKIVSPPCNVTFPVTNSLNENVQAWLNQHNSTNPTDYAVICLKKGTYSGCGNGIVPTLRTVYLVGSPEKYVDLSPPTVIDCQDSGRVIQAYGPNNVVVQLLTVKNTYVSTAGGLIDANCYGTAEAQTEFCYLEFDDVYVGGAGSHYSLPGSVINTRGNVSLTVTDFDFSSALSPVYLTDYTQALFSYGVIESSAGQDSSAMAIVTANPAASLNLNAVVFSKNTASSGGTVLFSTPGAHSVFNCYFFKNSARMGGGLLIVGGASVIEQNTVYQSNTADYGGGVCVAISTKSVAYTGAGAGGQYTSNNGQMEGNTCNRMGAALFIGMSTKATLTKATITDNKYNSKEVVKEYNDLPPAAIYASGKAKKLVFSSCEISNNKLPAFAVDKGSTSVVLSGKTSVCGNDGGNFEMADSSSSLTFQDSAHCCMNCDNCKAGSTTCFDESVGMPWWRIMLICMAVILALVAAVLGAIAYKRSGKPKAMSYDEIN